MSPCPVPQESPASMKWSCEFADMSPHRNQSMAHRGAIGEEKTSPGGSGVAGIQWGSSACHVENCVPSLRRQGQGWGNWGLDDEAEELGAELHPCAVPVWGRGIDMSLGE